MISFLVVLGAIIGLVGIFQPKLKNICGGVTFIVLYIVMVFNNNNVDYNSYSRNYYSGLFEHENVFSLIEAFFRSIGLSFAQFFAVVLSVCFLLVFITVKRLNVNPSAFCILYFLYPFCLDIIQIRNFLAYSFVFFALPLLINNDKKSKIIYTILVLIAASIHFSCIVYIFIIFYEFIKNSNKIKAIYGILTGVFILLTFNIGRLTSYLDFFQTTVYKYLNESRVYEMSINDIGERGYIVFYGVHFITILLMVLCYKYLNQQENVEIQTKNKRNIIIDVNTGKKYIEVVMWLGIVLTIFIPLYRFQATLFRITRNLMIIDYSALLVFTRLTNDKRKKYLFSFLCFILVCFLFWFEIYRGLNKELIFEAVLKNNWLN